jgi:hypothetical protein
MTHRVLVAAAGGAVVGGTGDYAGATGSFTSSDEAGTGKPSQDTFELFIPQD